PLRLERSLALDEGNGASVRGQHDGLVLPHPSSRYPDTSPSHTLIRATRGHTQPVATPTPPLLPAGERLRRAGIAAWSIIGLLILTAVAIYLLFQIRVIFAPLVMALLIIYLLNPLITWLARKGIPR